LVVDKKQPALQITRTSSAPVLKLAKCKGKPNWRQVAEQVPLETQLYQKSLHERPELFQE
jgi:hypothetical protein